MVAPTETICEFALIKITGGSLPLAADIIISQLSDKIKRILFT